jgi:hypothetical protein
VLVALAHAITLHQEGLGSGKKVSGHIPGRPGGWPVPVSECALLCITGHVQVSPVTQFSTAHCLQQDGGVALAERLERAAQAVKAVYSECPSYDVVRERPGRAGHVLQHSSLLSPSGLTDTDLGICCVQRWHHPLGCWA